MAKRTAFDWANKNPCQFISHKYSQPGEGGYHTAKHTRIIPGNRADKVVWETGFVLESKVSLILARGYDWLV